MRRHWSKLLSPRCQTMATIVFISDTFFPLKPFIQRARGAGSKLAISSFLILRDSTMNWITNVWIQWLRLYILLLLINRVYISVQKKSPFKINMIKKSVKFSHWLIVTIVKFVLPRKTVGFFSIEIANNVSYKANMVFYLF